ncbi:hypothetical protein ACFL42_00535 [Candidatus Omnitrophota bacterium]
MIRKVIGSILAIIGFLIFGWGLWIFAMSIYHNAAKTPHMGDAAYIGFYYGLTLIGVGLIPLLFGSMIFINPKAILGKMVVSKKHKIIIWATVILIILFMGLKLKCISLAEDKKTDHSHIEATLYGYTIGEQTRLYEKGNVSNKYQTRTITQSRKGLYKLGYHLAYNKYRLIIATLLIGFVLFIAVKEKTNVKE